MNMSKAALPPPYHAINDTDRRHPRFAEYMRWRAAMSCLLVEASSFKDWLSCQERFAQNAELSKHPHFQEFQQWMQDNQGGRAKVLPTGDRNTFPTNFSFWLDGGRW